MLEALGQLTGTANNIFVLSPMIFLFLFSLVPITMKVLNGNKEPSLLFSFHLPVVGACLALIATILISMINAAKDQVQVLYSNSLVVDGISTWTTVTIIIVLIFSLLMSRESLALYGRQFSEYVFLLFNSVVGMIVVAWSNDLVLTFIGIEVMSLCLYIMIALSRETNLSKEAALKYFVLGSFASAVFLYGIAFVYGTLGSTYLSEITPVAKEMISTSRMFLVGVVLIIIGLGFKVSVFPFHSWTPDVYHGSPTALTSFMATGVKVATFATFLRFMLTEALIGERAETMLVAMQWLAVLTMLAGNIAAIMQDNLKRMLAYSSIAHSGYLLVGLIAASTEDGQIAGSTGLIFYGVTYALVTVGSFGLVSLFETRVDKQVMVDDLKGLGSQQPYMALALTILMLSLAGIPPTVGFFGKLFIFSSALDQGFVWLVIWGVINSVISVYYYLRPVVTMYMQEGESVIERKAANTKFVVVFSSVMVIFLGLFANGLYEIARRSVESLF